VNQYFHDLCVQTDGFSMHLITRGVEKFVASSGLSNGLCQLSVLHTSASLLVQENASSDVQRDIVRFLNTLAPMDVSRYEHDLEGLDDIPAHLKTVLIQTHLTLSVRDSRLVLGTWQGIFLIEHRTRGSMRRVQLHLVG
jgi:secondary thiamine-phosphate synthase enzyme